MVISTIQYKYEIRRAEENTFRWWQLFPTRDDYLFGISGESYFIKWIKQDLKAGLPHKFY